ncbi:uncharacterized protein FFMR_14089 [Fusarium fujikuroi]|nr:uncharacterized protein FFMR_14089 [Fusarium fujikuroi]
MANSWQARCLITVIP